ncbi:hypothetical protein OHA72_27040 [Dactylosporangium sp. NBC_01737]|uniref:hypothetical protein n=1 Tax=Dactylosporangium sp. NBC_01737 TaxID=2975959 RepID=UPI002E0FBC4A|nr:hypothetical protein OHA72_27040 [Dactylosporangium sp. NBC_01737]
MAGSSVTVCVRVADGQPVAEAVAVALAPFTMAEDADGRWVSWRVGVTGRFGPLPVRTGSEGDPRILRVSEPPWWWSSGRCDAAPRGLIDFTRDRAAARYWAGAEWDDWYEVARRHPVGRPVSEFAFQNRAVFAGQPVMRAYMQRYGLDPQRMVWDRFNDPMTRFGYDRDDYLAREVARAAPVAELLRLDGVWLDYGDFSTGMFDERAHDRYHLAADAYLEALPEDVYIVRIHIHC